MDPNWKLFFLKKIQPVNVAISILGWLDWVLKCLFIILALRYSRTFFTCRWNSAPPSILLTNGLVCSVTHVPIIAKKRTFLCIFSSNATKTWNYPPICRRNERFTRDSYERIHKWTWSKQLDLTQTQKLKFQIQKLKLKLKTKLKINDK